jgi:hypothetical protein
VWFFGSGINIKSGACWFFIMASKRSRIEYYNDSRPFRPFGLQPKIASPNDPLSFLVKVLKKRDGMVARAVKYKLRLSQNVHRTTPQSDESRRPQNVPRIPPQSDEFRRSQNVSRTAPHFVDSHRTSEIANLNAVIEQLRCSNKQLLDENSFLKIKCTQLELDLKSANTLVIESSSNCELALTQHKVLEDKITSLTDENVSLSHKVNTLSLQLSDITIKSSKLPQLKTEIAKLNNVNDVLKKCAKKFEVGLKEKISDLEKVTKEKNNLAALLEESENVYCNDINHLSFLFSRLSNCIRSSKDPPEEWLYPNG